MDDATAQNSLPGATAQEVPRRGRGSLAGQIVLADDWDSPDTNEQLANTFDLSVLTRAAPATPRSISK